VAIARALANNPRLILADEPTGELDTKTAMRIIELLKELNRKKGITVIIVTHDPRVANETKRVVTLQDGAVLGDSMPIGEKE
jgi:putative ABC transport system ATP-binding protein